MRRLIVGVAIALGLTAIQLPAFTNNVALEPSGGDHVVFVSKYGNDANSGLSWGNAFKTIGHAVAVMTRGGDIYIGAGYYTESVTINTWHLSLHGVRGDPATAIIPPSDTADGIDINKPDVSIENLRIGAYATWNAVGFNLTGASGASLRNVAVQTLLTQGTATAGGVGLAFVNTEGALVEQYSCHAVRLCIQLGNQLSATSTLDGGVHSVFIDTSASGNYQELVQWPHSGGEQFHQFRAVNTTCPNVVPALDVRGDNNIFDMADIDESPCPNQLSVTGNFNSFRNMILAPQSILTVAGKWNSFDELVVQRAVIVTGANNTFRSPVVLYSRPGGFTDQGKNTIVENPYCGTLACFTYNPTTRHPVYTVG